MVVKCSFLETCGLGFSSVTSLYCNRPFWQEKCQVFLGNTGNEVCILNYIFLKLVTQMIKTYGCFISLSTSLFLFPHEKCKYFSYAQNKIKDSKK